ncbi:glycosyltransferase family 4 protein [Echinicola sediminis]
MRIVYVHQYFLTPEEGGAVRSYHLAKGMVDAGIDVEVITAHNKLEYDFKIISGVKVHYLPVAYDNKFGFIKRVYAFIDFVRQAKRLLQKIHRPDLLYITSTPLTTGLIGLWAKRKMALPYIFEVRDLWPEAPVQVGAIRHSMLKKALYKMEKRIYQHALKVVALSPGIRNYIYEKVPEAHISLIPNFSDVDFFKPVQTKDKTYLETLGWKEDRLTLAYAGAIGDVNALEDLLELAKAAQDSGKDWQFGIMGKGRKLAALKQKAGALKLKNLAFLPFGDKDAVRKLLSVSDVAVISFDQLPVLRTNSPNKFFDALAMGKAILINHRGWIHDLVMRNGLGLYYDIKKPISTVGELEKLDENPGMLKAMGKRARNLAEMHFTKEMALARLLYTLDPKKYPRPAIDEVYMLIA